MRRTKAMDLQGLARLRGVRLILRPPQRVDSHAIYAYASEPLVTRYLAWPRHASLADSECFLLRAIADWSCGENLVWLIEDESGVVGAIGVRISAVNAGIGYVLASNRWGQGYAGEALQLVGEALSRHSPVRTLWALCVEENIASTRVLEKGGFHVDRTLNNYFSCPNEGGRAVDVVVYTRSLGISRKRHQSPAVVCDGSPVGSVMK